MSAYPPPKENLPIYNPTDFEYENFPLTIQDAKDYFLEYPTAQGAETLASIIVNGASTFNDVATINDSLDIIQPTSTLNALNIQNDETGYAIRATQKTGSGGIFQLSSSASTGKDNGICIAGDCVLSGGITNTTGALTLVPRNTGVGQGIRLVYNANEMFGSTEIKNGDASNPGQLVFPDGTIQTTAPVGANNYTYTQQILSTAGSGVLQSITIPANCSRCDIGIYGAGGSAGLTNYFGSYAVNGGSGGGASMVGAIGVPLNASSTMTMEWTSGSGNFTQVYLNGSPANNLGSGYNGGDGSPGISGGTGTKGFGATQSTPTPSFPNSNFLGLDGSDGGSQGFPNSNIPAGGTQPTKGGGIQFIGYTDGGLGMGQRYSATTGAGGSFNYPASPHIAVGGVKITWYISI
tara:strand:- start:261 stop:1481 length:1221 start_codon:yes stop_codon:yes gene_type:complete